MPDVCDVVMCVLAAAQVVVSLAWFAHDLYTVKRNERRPKG